MPTYKKFEDLEVWKLAREFCQQVQQWIETTDLKTDYSLRKQLERSSGSTMDNIAEGFERSGNKEFIYFLFIAKGSAGECRSQLYRLFDKRLISEDELNEQIQRLENLSLQLNRFINYLKNSEYKGWHLKEGESRLWATRTLNLQIFNSSNE